MRWSSWHAFRRSQGLVAVADGERESGELGGSTANIKRWAHGGGTGGRRRRRRPC